MYICVYIYLYCIYVKYNFYMVAYLEKKYIQLSESLLTGFPELLKAPSLHCSTIKAESAANAVV